MVRVTVETEDGNLASGAAFHIGDGWLVTARHVIDSGRIHEVVPHHLATGQVQVARILVPEDHSEDARA
jgi:V8-like Glu-specific endopeptidase